MGDAFPVSICARIRDNSALFSLQHQASPKGDKSRLLQVLGGLVGLEGHPNKVTHIFGYVIVPALSIFSLAPA